MSSPAKRRRPATICAVSEGKEPFPGINEIISKLAEREKPTDTTKPGIQHPIIHATTAKDETPPPVPPKPIVIRADQIFDSQNQWQFSPIQPRRKNIWYAKKNTSALLI